MNLIELHVDVHDLYVDVLYRLCILALNRCNESACMSCWFLFGGNEMFQGI